MVTREVVKAPPWLIRLMTPLLARHAAVEIRKQHPHLDPQEIAAKMRADIGNQASPETDRFIDAVVSRLPEENELAAEKPVSAWVLLAANLVPVAGVLLWDWSVFALLVLFWMENVLLGLFFVLRMLCADPLDPALWGGKLLLVPFFCVHYGMFTAIHGLFVFALFGGKGYGSPGLQVLEPAVRAASDLGLWLPLAVLFASHGFSFLWNYLYRGEFRRAQLTRLMAQPYGRVAVLHLTIIFGGMGAMALGSPMWALLVLLALKIGLDWKAHLKEHSATK